MSSASEITVLLEDSDISQDDLVQRFSDWHVLHLPLLKNSLKNQNLFILTSTTALPEVTPIARAAKRQDLLRALLVRLNVAPTLIPLMWKKAKMRSFDKVFLYEDSDIPNRVLAAWDANAQEQLIASATLMQDNLLVTDCALKTWEIPFNSLPALAAIPRENRDQFEIDEDGSYLYWPTEDIHLDMESLRLSVDRKFQESIRAETTIFDNRFGAAVAAVMTKRQLNTSDIPGISLPEIQEIEKGSRPPLETIRKLSAAHGMSVNEYLEEIARTMASYPHPPN